LGASCCSPGLPAPCSGDSSAIAPPGGHFRFAGWSLLASLPCTLLAVLAPQPALFWPAMGVTLVLLFLNTGPLTAALINVLPPTLRARGVALCALAIHLFGDALSPSLIGSVADQVGLMVPVLATGLLLPVAGEILLAGRRVLAQDLARGAA